MIDEGDPILEWHLANTLAQAVNFHYKWSAIFDDIRRIGSGDGTESFARNDSVTPNKSQRVTFQKQN